jgi:Tfp pilus assembly protein PilF
MRAMAVAALTVLAGWAMAKPAAAGTACDDAVARGVWDLAIDVCSPEMLPADVTPEQKAQALLGRSRAYKETGDAERAAADVAEAKRLDPNSAAAFDAAQAARTKASGDLRQTLKTIEAQWRGGQANQALAALDQTIAANPNSAQAYALRASIYLSRRDDARAQADIQSATKLARNCALAPKNGTYVFTCPE